MPKEKSTRKAPEKRQVRRKKGKLILNDRIPTRSLT
jgi:hypothetical protein